MRCVIPVDPSKFAAGTQSQTLVGPDTGFEACQVICSRWTQFQARPSLRALHADHLYFVVSGEIHIQIDDQKVVASAGTLVRVPGETPHCSWNTAAADALYLEIIAPAQSTQGSAAGALKRLRPPDLGALVRREPFERSGGSPKGFEYTFLANRALGSEHIALNVARVQPGHQGPDYHIHKFDQFYFVLRGRLTVDVGFERHEAGPLSLVVLPAGIVHRQRNEGSEVEEHLAIITPEPPPGGRLDYQITMPSSEV